jgi:hypothetical protein
MDRFIARKNIKHFRDCLWSGGCRSDLQKLLVAKRSRRCHERNGHNALRTAQVLLDGMIEGQLLHVKYREGIPIAIKQNGRR